MSEKWQLLKTGRAVCHRSTVTHTIGLTVQVIAAAMSFTCCYSYCHLGYNIVYNMHEISDVTTQQQNEMIYLMWPSCLVFFEASCNMTGS